MNKGTNETKLVFITKEKKSIDRTKTCEVGIRIRKNGRYANGEERYSIAFILSENAKKKIMANSDYLVYALYRGRVYFKESDATNGYKASKAGEGQKNRSVCIQIGDRAEWADFIGDYNLLYDQNEKLYYVDTNNKIRL